MKHLNLNLNKTLTPNSNIVLSSQQAIKSYIDSKKVFVQFLQESVPTTFKAGDKWVNTSSNKLFIATNDTTWDNGSNLDTTAIYSFGNLLYHYNGTDTKCYSTTSITEQNANKEIKEWFGTQNEYNAIETKDENTHYIIIDDTSTSSSLLATQEEFNNSVTDKAATPKQVNEKIGNYLPLAGGNLDKGAILRFTNTNNQVSSMSLDENKYITMSDNLKVSGDINTNSLVSTTGNIYKGNSSGATNIWSDSFATTEKAGIIKVGNNLTIAEDGTLNAEAGGGSGFDFEGTKAEFDAAVAAGTITEDSVSLITDDVSGDNVATKAELQNRVSKAGDTMTGTLIFPDSSTSVQFGVGSGPNRHYYIKQGSVGELALYYIDENNVSKGLFLIANETHRPYYFDGTTGYRLLTTEDLENLQTQINSLNTEVTGMLGRMNFNARVDFSLSHRQSYTVPSKGYLWINYIGGTGGIAYINGGTLAYGESNDSASSSVRAFVPVSEGDVLSVANSSGSSTSVNVVGFFVPQV